MWLTDRLFRKQGRHARAPTVRPRGFQTALSTKEKWQLVGEWAALSGVAAWLFYDSWWALLPLAVCFPFYRRFRREALLRKRRMRYASEFQEGMQAMAASIRAGDSAERAVLEALKDLRSIHGKDTAMMEELELMTRELSMNRTPEQLLSELADRSGLEDAVCFADIFHAAKRTGGNLVQIMEQTADIMEARETVQREIEVLTAGRRYEQRIMCMIPFGIILYIRTGSPGYLDALYHCAAGICMMTLCLVIYAAAVYLGGRVLQIEV